jgi:pimeloyl-ACP methyl ester carboxylesterase
VNLTARVEAWRDAGWPEEFRARRIHVHHRGGDGTPVVLLHGFPSSSYDWRLILPLLGEGPVLAFDFLGFGLSDKPRDHVYGLGWQADLTDELVRRHLGGGPVFVVAHDMGTSVATELMARELDGSHGIEISGALLFNGSMILELASPTLGQKLLRSRIGPLAARLSSERFFRQQFGSIFSPGHPLSDAEAEDQWCLITEKDGHRIGHLLVNYMDERVRHAERWHGAIRDWPNPLSFAWGMLDPVANARVLGGLRELRPEAPVTEFPDLGHYPQLEDPERLAAAAREALEGAARER